MIADRHEQGLQRWIGVIDWFSAGHIKFVPFFYSSKVKRSWKLEDELAFRFYEEAIDTMLI